jgi:enoyl-CoA hydratase
MFDHILYNVTNGVALIEHNRPEVRNAENQQLLMELDAAVAQALSDSAVRVIVIGGTGAHFSAGHDLKEGQQKRTNLSVEERWAYEERHFLRYCLNIWDSPKPTIARVQGACISGGFMVANMCDLIVASEDAFFADPVVHSMSASAVEVLVHPWVLGLRRAKELLFTGQSFSARDAYEFGMINRIVQRDDLEAATQALAEQIAKAPPFAVGLTKRSLNRAFDIQGFRASIEAHFDTHQLSHATEEMKAVRAKGFASAVSTGKQVSS